MARESKLFVGFVTVMMAALFLPGTGYTEQKPATNPRNTGPLARSSGGPDDFGYVFQDNASGEGCESLYNWVDVSTTGTQVLAGADDDDAANLPMGFSFPFYGTDFTQFTVGSNGTIYFVDDYLGLSNECLPGDGGYGIDRFIALYWDDLIVDGGVYYQTFSTCPVGVGSCTVVQFHQAREYGAADQMEFEAILFSDGTILIQYQSLASYTGDGATVGIQDSMTTPPDNYLEYSCNAASLSDGLAVAFAPPGAQDASGAPLICSYAAATPTPQAAPAVPAAGGAGLAVFLLAIAAVAVLVLRRTS